MGRSLTNGAALLGLLACLSLVLGCGGSGGSGGPIDARPGTLQVSVVWPAKRVIPRATQSIGIDVGTGEANYGSQTLNYPATTARFEGIPPGSLIVRATAYPEPNRGGVILAAGAQTVNLSPGGEATTQVDMNSAIQSVEIGGLPPGPIAPGQSFPIALSGRSALGSLIPIDQSAVNWLSENTAVVRIKDGVATGVAVGQARIVGADIESGRSADATIIVSSNAGGVIVGVKNDLTPIEVKVVVLSYNPIIPSTGKRVFASRPEYTDPVRLTDSFIKEMFNASSGIVNYKVVDFRTLDYVPRYSDGTQLAPQEYFDRMMAGTLPQGIAIDHEGMLLRENVQALVNSNAADEVFVYYDGPGMAESWMLGPRSFFINGGPYPSFPTTKPFVAMGFTPFVKTGNMMHSLGHRTEDSLQRFFGRWNLAAPVTRFDKFSANFHDSPGVLAGVGTVHFPANASEGYQTDSTREVESCAQDFLTPHSGPPTRRLVSRNNWGDAIGGMEETTETQIEYERGYQRWRFRHFPKFTGRDPAGRLNNWWRYIYRFDDYYSEAILRSVGSPASSQGCTLR